MAPHTYLRKANDDFINHCKCPSPVLVSAPGQLDCPWCGCGWLFSCSRCQRAFTFAEGVEIDESWEEIAAQAITSRYRRPPEPGEVAEWVDFMQLFLREVEVGERYVYLDGYVIPADVGGIQFEGWHSIHDLDFVPQVEAMSSPEIKEMLCSREYWESRRVEEEEEEEEEE